MTAALSMELPLPRLRPDLAFHRGPPETDGSPTWTLHDPLTGTYRKLGWAEAAVFRRLPTCRTLGALLAELRQSTTLRLQPDDILRFCEQARQEQLTVASSVRPVGDVQAEAAALRLHPLMWLLTHYLFIRIPLLHPDAFLTRTLPWVRWLVSRPLRIAYAACGVVGLLFLALHAEDYVNTFPYFFNARGVVYYVVALVGLKVVHEFAHAYTAKALGVRVPTMGVALLVFCPVAFCDVTDGWKLPRRRDRFWISAAGIASEVVVAGLALFGCAVTEDGPLRSVFFVLSSVTLLSTLLVNLNPAMRFDGYYILGDLWGIDNLRPRAFAVTRWALRKWLLGVRLTSPEPGISRRRLAGLVVYSLYAWAYRIVLYLGIAVLVYAMFAKAVGAMLFAFSVYWFFVRPLILEVRALIRLKDFLHWNPRSVLCTAAFAGGVLWAALPLSRDLAVPAVVVCPERQILYAPESGVLRALCVRRGQRVEAGEELFRIESEELEAHRKILAKEVERLARELIRVGLEEKSRSRIGQTREELDRVRAQVRALEERMQRNRVTASTRGTVYEWDEAVRNGTPVARGTELGRVARLDANAVVAFVHEDYTKRLDRGADAWFVSRTDSVPRPARVRSVLPVQEETLPHEALGSTLHGDLPVVETPEGRRAIVGSYYRIEVALEEGRETLRLGQTGHVWVETAPRSLIADGVRRAWRVLLRESGF